MKNQLKSFKKPLRKFIGPNVEKNAPEATPGAPKSYRPGGVLGPKVPVRGKEFLPETPGSRFAIGKSSCKQPSSKQIKSKALKSRHLHLTRTWCAGRHGADQ